MFEGRHCTYEHLLHTQIERTYVMINGWIGAGGTLRQIVERLGWAAGKLQETVR